MKEIINYYYKIDIKNLKEEQNYCTFNYNGEVYYFVFFNRTIQELNDILDIVYELKNKGYRVHDIIINNQGFPLTKVGDNNYLLLKLNIKEDEIIDFEKVCINVDKLKLNGKNSKLYRNNWGELWSNKIDYIEYQIKEIGKDKKIVLDSLSYYIGLAENAISYVNKTNKIFNGIKENNLSLSHRRIFFPNIALNYMNPLSFIFDIEIRDIAEYLKGEFFVNGDSLEDLKIYLKSIKISPYLYHMLYARLLYPSYYFDIYEDIMNNNSDEENLIKIIDKVNDYEIFLKEAYLEISKYTNLVPIDWIQKKN